MAAKISQTIVAAGMWTHRSWVTYICVGNLTTIGSDKGLSPGQRQAITWTNVGILLIGPPRNKLQWNVYRNSYIFTQENSFEIVVCKWRPFCLGLNVLTHRSWVTYICVCKPGHHYVGILSEYSDISTTNVKYTHIMTKTHTYRWTDHTWVPLWSQMYSLR